MTVPVGTSGVGSGIIYTAPTSVVYATVTAGSTSATQPAENLKKIQEANNAIYSVRRQYEARHRQVERLNCVSKAFKEARHIELNDNCQKVIMSIASMSGQVSIDEHTEYHDRAMRQRYVQQAEANAYY